MSDTKNDSHVLSSNEMWAKSAEKGSVSREELGIQSHQSTNGVTSLNEGTQMLTFELNKNSQNSSGKNTPD